MANGLRATAALVLTLGSIVPINAAKLRLPPPTAARNQIYSPGAVAKTLQKLGYRIETMKRKGTTYSVLATGPNRNRVQLTIDGRNRAILGLAVLKAEPSLAKAIAAIVRSGKGARYVDDRHPFGILVPTSYQSRWTPVTSWTTYSSEYVTETWSGAGYRFAVPYDTIRPGFGGASVTTFTPSEMGEPVYDVYESNGSEMVTEYSEETLEITATESFEAQYSAQNEQFEESYLDGSIEESAQDADEIADYDSEDGDFAFSDNGSDDYDADLGDEDDDTGSAVEADDEEDEDSVDDTDDDGSDDDDDDDGGDDDDDDGGDDDDDDGGDDDPEALSDS